MKKTDNKFDKKDFINNYATNGIRINIKCASILAYIRFGIAVCIHIYLLFHTPIAIISLIECLIRLGIVIGFHLRKSKACAIVWLCWECLCVFVGILNLSFKGIFMLLLSIWAVKTMLQADREYNQYIKSIL